MIPHTLLAGATLSLCAMTAHATDLLQVWQAARQHDPQGAVIDASRAATTGVSFGTSVNGGTATRWALSAHQPLHNKERQAQRQQLVISADSAEIQ